MVETNKIKKTMTIQLVRNLQQYLKSLDLENL